MTENASLTDFTEKDRSTLQFLKANALALRAEKSDEDAGFMRSLVDAAETEENPDVRYYAHHLIQQVVTGDYRKEYANKREDLLDTELHGAVLRIAENEKDPSVRREAMRTTQIVSDAMPPELIDAGNYASVFRLASNEHAPEVRVLAYVTRMLVLPCRSDYLTPDLVATLAQPAPADATDQTNRILYATRAEIITRQQNFITPELTVEFVKHARAIQSTVDVAGGYMDILRTAGQNEALLDGLRRIDQEAGNAEASDPERRSPRQPDRNPPRRPKP